MKGTLSFVFISVVCVTVYSAETVFVPTADFGAGLHVGARETCATCNKNVKKLRGFEGQIIVPRGGDIVLARDWAFQAAAQNALVLSNYSKSPDIGLARLGEHPQRVIVIHDTPIDVNDIKKMHSIEANSKQIEYMKSINNQISKYFAIAHELIDLKKSPGQASAVVRKLIDNRNKDDLLVVLSHTAKGNMRFHDGSELPLLGVESPGYVIVVGCNTIGSLQANDPDDLFFGIGRRISYEEGAAIGLRIASQGMKGSSYRDILLSIQNNPPEKIQLNPQLPKPETFKYESKKEGELPEAIRVKIISSPVIGVVSRDAIAIGVGDERGSLAFNSDKQFSHSNAQVYLRLFDSKGQNSD